MNGASLKGLYRVELERNETVVINNITYSASFEELTYSKKNVLSGNFLNKNNNLKKREKRESQEATVDRNERDWIQIILNIISRFSMEKCPCGIILLLIFIIYCFWETFKTLIIFLIFLLCLLLEFLKTLFKKNERVIVVERQVLVVNQQ